MANKKNDNVKSSNRSKNPSNVKPSNRPMTRAELERRKKLREKYRRRAKVRRSIAAAILTILVLIIIVGVYLFSFVSSLNNNNNMVKAINPKGKSPVNILLLGMDIGDTQNPNNQSAKRTDTMMVLNYNPTTDKVNLVSIPRDTLIEVEDAYDGEGNYIPYWKMNAAYVLGGEDELIYQVEKLLDITVNYLVEIDYAAFRNLIDSIGGVKMYIDRDMYYDDDAQDLHINFKAGETVLLDGQKAEEFFRWRQNNDGTGLEDGDLGRIQNQQKFISALIKKCTNPLILLDIPNVLNVVKENVTTNMPGNKIIKYGIQVLLNKGINMTTLQGYNEIIYGQDFLVVEQEDNAEILDALKTGNTKEEDNRSIYSIKILNGTRVNGLAGNFKNELESLGYSNISVGNTTRSEKSLILCNDSKLKGYLSNDTGINKIEKNKDDEYKDYDAVIIIGEDYLIYE